MECDSPSPCETRERRAGSGVSGKTLKQTQIWVAWPPSSGGYAGCPIADHGCGAADEPIRPQETQAIQPSGASPRTHLFLLQVKALPVERSREGVGRRNGPASSRDTRVPALGMGHHAGARPSSGSPRARPARCGPDSFDDQAIGQSRRVGLGALARPRTVGNIRRSSAIGEGLLSDLAAGCWVRPEPVLTEGYLERDRIHPYEPGAPRFVPDAAGLGVV